MQISIFHTHLKASKFWSFNLIPSRVCFKLLIYQVHKHTKQAILFNYMTKYHHRNDKSLVLQYIFIFFLCNKFWERKLRAKVTLHTKHSKQIIGWNEKSANSQTEDDDDATMVEENIKYIFFLFFPFSLCSQSEFAPTSQWDFHFIYHALFSILFLSTRKKSAVIYILSHHTHLLFTVIIWSHKKKTQLWFYLLNIWKTQSERTPRDMKPTQSDIWIYLRVASTQLKLYEIKDIVYSRPNYAPPYIA